jgi:tRNA(Ile)-lysidine synthase
LNADAADLLAEEDLRVFEGARTDEANVLSLETLRAQPPPRRARVLRRWIASLGLPPLPAEGIARFESDLLSGAPDADFTFEWSGTTLRRWRHLLRAARTTKPIPAGWTDTWDGRAPLILPDGGTLVLEGTGAFDAPLRVRLRDGGERLVLPGRAHSHSLKHALQDADIPPWERERMPLIVDADDTVLAAGDRLVSAPFDAWLRAHGARLQWTPPASH